MDAQENNSLSIQKEVLELMDTVNHAIESENRERTEKRENGADKKSADADIKRLGPMPNPLSSAMPRVLAPLLDDSN